MNKISTFGVEGATLLAALHAECFDAPWSESEMVRLLDGTGVQGLTLERDDVLVGLALIRVIAGEAEILTLGVIPAARRAGLGAQLVEAILTTARRAKAERIFLEVAEPNTPARALYARAGFAEVGRRAGYYRDGSTALVLARDL